MRTSRGIDRPRTSWRTLGLVGGATGVVTAFATGTGSVSVAPALALGAAASLDLVFSRNTANRFGIDLGLKAYSGEVGDDVQFELDSQTSSGTAKLTMRPLGLADFESISVVPRKGRVEAPWIPTAIGTVTHVELELEVYHLGLAPQRRTTVTPLDQPLYCLPATQTSDAVSPAASEAERLHLYVPGDRPSRIDWRATARTGQLHSRSSTPADDEVVLAVDLGPDKLGPESRSRSLQAAADAGRSSLRAGRLVRLLTREMPERAMVRWPYGEDTLVVDRLCTERELLRRLARAVTGPTFDYPVDAMVFSPSVTSREAAL